MSPLTLCKCLSDDTRLNIVMLLRQQRELCVCEIVDSLGQPQPTVSRHLSQLRQCALLAARRDAQWIYYQLDPQLPLWAAEVLEKLAEGASFSRPPATSPTITCR